MPKICVYNIFFKIKYFMNLLVSNKIFEKCSFIKWPTLAIISLLLNVVNLWAQEPGCGTIISNHHRPPSTKSVATDRTVNDFCIQIKAFVTPLAVAQIGSGNVTSAINSAISTANTRWSKANNPTLDDNISYSLSLPIVQWASIPFTWDVNNANTSIDNFYGWYLDQGYSPRTIGVVFAANSELTTVVGIANFGGNNPLVCDWLPDYIFGGSLVRIGNSVVVAHELGHLWGCDHDANSPCYIMSVNGCGTVFSANSVNIINQSTSNLETGCFSEVACSTLPIELTEFRAEQNGHSNRIIWQTTAEINHRGFQVERSTDGVSFQKIGFLPAIGPQGGEYFFEDDQFLASLNYYRLRIVAESGDETFSKILSVNRQEKQPRPQIAPNPTSGQLTLFSEAASEDSPAILRIFDTKGQLLMEKKVISEKSNLDISGFANGIFWLEMRTERGVFIEKIRKSAD